MVPLDVLKLLDLTHLIDSDNDTSTQRLQLRPALAMYGRQQPPPQAYPRQFGNAYPPQQQQQQYPPQYPPQGGYPPQQPHYGNRHQQQPPYGGQYGAQTAPRGPYGYQSSPAPAPGPPSTPMVRGAVPYGARTPAPVVSSYESQAQKWKKGFTAVPGAAGSGGGSSRQSDIEAPLIAELCSSAGSSYPPRDVLQKLLRYLPSLDHEYVCELLDDKLENRVWQVQGKALSVLDALFKSQEAEFYKTYYCYRAHILEALCSSRKELLKARAEKVYNVVKSHVPPTPSSPVNAQQPEVQSSLLPQSPIESAPAPVQEVNLLGSPLMLPQEAPASAPPSSAFGFLNASIGSAAPPPPPAAVAVEEPAPVSAFSFLSSQQSAPAPAEQAHVTRVVAVSPVAAPAVDIFSSLPPPTPVVGLVSQIEAPPPAPPAEEELKVHDPIHDAFEGLNFGDDNDSEAAAGGESSDNPLEGFSTTGGGTMGSAAANVHVHAPVIKIDPSDPTREIILEVDVPAGPMGLMLDRSVPDMAIVQGFLRMPTGERGYLELHPVLCPGCALVSINSVNVEDKGLEEVGAILGSLVNSYKVLQFKKLMRGGRTVSPANPDVVYVPPPPEIVEEPLVEEEEDQQCGEAEDGSEFVDRLAGYSSQLDAIETQIEELVQRDRSRLPVGDLKNQLAQLHGNVEKIQTQGIDSVILGANPPANADEIRQLRSSLVRRADELTKRIQKIAINGTAPSPHVAPIAVGSPEVSAFSFVVGASGHQEADMPAMPPLKLPLPVAAPAPASGFSFMQSSASPVSSPQGAASFGSAFGFLSGGGPSAAMQQPPSPAAPQDSVFAGLDLRAVEPEAPSAFGFLSGAANALAATPVGVVEPPQVASPTAFSFMRGAIGSPPSSPAAAKSAGSAFSFIS